jgi:hypothetical protein
MKKNRSLPIIAILITLLYILTGCTKKCDEFNSDIINWLPYKKTDLIILTNNTNKDTLTLKSNIINHTEKIKRNTKCTCEDSYSLIISSDSILINVDFYDSRSIDFSFVKINNDNLNYSELLNSYQLNGKNYSNVIIYKNDSQNSTKRFDKLVISKNIGIIEIIGVSEEWIIENDNIKNIEVSEIDYNKSDC